LTATLFDAPLRILKPKIPGIRIRRCGQEVSAALILQTVEELDMVFDQSHSAPGLDEGPAFSLGFDNLQGVVLFRRDRLQVFNCFVQVDLPACRPQREDFLPFL
jgi:hypothetical protein